MRQTIKRFLQQQNVYTGLKYHPVFRAYEIIFKPEVTKQKRREISFYKSFLPATNLIFDIGAYDGHKTEAFLHIAERVIACEPDCTNFNVLETRFRRHQKRVHLENVVQRRSWSTPVRVDAREPYMVRIEHMTEQVYCFFIAVTVFFEEI